MSTLDFKVAKLEFSAPLHLGVGREGEHSQSEEIIHSDTLKSALFVCALQLNADLQQPTIGEQFLNSFTISSAFPYINKEYLFPFPLYKNNGIKEKIKEWFNTEDGKELTDKETKKATYISKLFFENYINGLSSPTPSKGSIYDRKYLCEFGIKGEKLISETAIQKVQVSRYHDDATPYYISQVYFKKNTGLYCLVQFNTDDAQMQELFWNAFNLLGQEGIGMDRSSGNGFFKIEQDTLSLEVPIEPNAQIALSLYCPTEDEFEQLSKTNRAYELIKRGGYITHYGNGYDYLTYRKRSINMFKEGSMFETKSLVGKLVDLRPNALSTYETPIWREGRALFIPTILNLNSELV